jgi:hypothetical protein
MMLKLQNSSDPSEKLSLASFLASTIGLRPELSEWCRQEIAAQRDELVAQSGMDLWVGKPVLVIQRLKQLLTPA